MQVMCLHTFIRPHQSEGYVKLLTFINVYLQSEPTNVTKLEANYRVDNCVLISQHCL